MQGTLIKEKHFIFKNFIESGWGATVWGEGRVGEKIPGLKLLAKCRVTLKNGREDSRRGNIYIHKEQGMYEKSPSEQDNEVRGEYQKTKNPLLPAIKRVCLRNKLNGFCFLIKLRKRKNVLALRTRDRWGKMFPCIESAQREEQSPLAGEETETVGIEGGK